MRWLSPVKQVILGFALTVWEISSVWKLFARKLCSRVCYFGLWEWLSKFVDSINSIAEHLNILISRPHFQACSRAESCIYSWWGISNCLNKWNSETKELWVKHRLKWGFLIQKKHRSFSGKEVIAAKIIWTRYSRYPRCSLCKGCMYPGCVYEL